MQTRTQTAGRLALLDGMRGLAAAAVALIHGCAIFNSGAPLITMHNTTFIRLFTEGGFAWRAVSARIYAVLQNRLGLAAPLLTEDRRVLEQIIFAHYIADPHIRNVLFVGCAPYTAHYARRYFSRHNYWTIDPDPARRRFGAKQHVLARLEELGSYFPEGCFDLIICNGVYGWGLNSADECEAAVGQCHSCLADRGHMLFGWNDEPMQDPAPLSAVRGLERFSRIALPALGVWEYLTRTHNRHTYRFYQKAEQRREHLG